MLDAPPPPGRGQALPRPPGVVAESAVRDEPGSARGTPRLAAVAALIGVLLLVWAVTAFVPDLALRAGRRAGLLAVPARGLVEGVVVAATSLVTIVAALLLALTLRAHVALGSLTLPLTLAALPAGAAGFTVALALSWAAGVVVPGPPRPLDGAVFGVGWLLTLCAALAEELLFRGVLQPVLARAWGIAAALVAQAALFAVAHYIGGWRDPVSLFNIFLAAIWLGLLARGTGGIAAPVLAHAAWNGAESLLFGAAPNPGPGPFGSLIDVDIAGPALLGGSPDGLNASVTATLALAALIAPLALRPRGWRR